MTLRLDPTAYGTAITPSPVKFRSLGGHDGHCGDWTLILDRLAAALTTAHA